MRALATCVFAAVVTAAAGCGADAPTGPDRPAGDPLAVSLTVDPATVTPGQTSLVTTTAKVPDTLALSRFEIALSGMDSDTVVDLPITGPGSHTYFLQLEVPHGPIAGQLRFTARARVGTVTDSAQGTLVIADDGLPGLALMGPAIVEPPDSLTLRIDAQDAAGITELAVRVAGALQRDTIVHSNCAPQLHWEFRALIPTTARLGDSVVVDATVRDGFGNLSRRQHKVRLADSTLPTLSLQVDTVHHAGLDESYFPLAFFPGDTVRIRMQAADNRALAWVGYRMPALPFADSVATTSASQTAQFEFTVPPGTNTPNGLIRAFARDSAGNEVLQGAYAVVIDGTFRPIQSLSPYETPLHEFDEHGGYVLDARRDVLYFARFVNAVHVVALSPLAARPDIVFNGSVRSVDLTPSGDTLVVLVVGRPNLLVRWNIAGGPSTADTIPITQLGNCDAWDMQVSENSRAFVTGWSPSGCPTVEVDLRTRAQTTRGIPSSLRNLVASGNHRLIVAWSATDALSYRADTDVLTPCDRSSRHPAASSVWSTPGRPSTTPVTRC